MVNAIDDGDEAVARATLEAIAKIIDAVAAEPSPAPVLELAGRRSTE